MNQQSLELLLKINQYSPDQIKSINILKNASAVEKFGPEGKNGVIIIELKK